MQKCKTSLVAYQQAITIPEKYRAKRTTSIAAEKVNPEAVSKGMLTALNNQVCLSADQQEKAKPIIDKHVDDLEAVKNDATLDKAAKKAKIVQLRHQYVTDINGILINSRPTEKMGGV